MQITIDTSLPLNDVERQVLFTLLGGEPIEVQVEVGEHQPAATYSTDAERAGEDPVEDPEPEPEKPARKSRARKAPEPEPEPEPAAEEPLEEEPEDEPDEDLIGEEDTDEMSDEDLLKLAVKKATEMVASGGAAQVREALDAAGASRVRELNADNVRDFFQALG